VTAGRSSDEILHWLAERRLRSPRPQCSWSPPASRHKLPPPWPYESPFRKLVRGA